MNNELSNSTIKVVGVGVLILLSIILLLVGYSVLKTPVINKGTIDALIKTANNTEMYVKELREIAEANRVQTGQDNILLQNGEKNRGESYKDLYDKYGIVTGDGLYAKNNHGNVAHPSGDRMRSENKVDGREQLPTNSK